MAQWGFSLIGAARAVAFAAVVEDHVEGIVHSDSVYIVEAGRGLRYGWFVEFGTAITPAQPYMRPAVKSAARQQSKLWAEAKAGSGDAVDNFKENIADHIYKVARREVPVDTGALRDSITVRTVKVELTTEGEITTEAV